MHFWGISKSKIVQHQLHVHPFTLIWTYQHQYTLEQYFQDRWGVRYEAVSCIIDAMFEYFTWRRHPVSTGCILIGCGVGCPAAETRPDVHIELVLVSIGTVGVKVCACTVWMWSYASLREICWNCCGCLYPMGWWFIKMYVSMHDLDWLRKWKIPLLAPSLLMPSSANTMAQELGIGRSFESHCQVLWNFSLVTIELAVID